MGWLDALFGNNQFDPQSYSGGGGWLGPIAGGPVPFDRTQPPSGFPTVASQGVAAQPRAAPPQMAVAGIGREADQPNPLTSLFGGAGDAINGGLAGLLGQGGPGAPQGPNLLDRLTAGANNLTSGGNPIAGLFNAVNGLATGQRTDRAGVELAQQQATMQALMNSGVDPAVARAAVTNPDYFKAIMAARYRAGPTAQRASVVPRVGANAFAGAQPGAMQPTGPNAAEPPHGSPSNVSPRVAPLAQPLSRVATPTEAARLPSGTHFVDPQGVERVVP